MSIFNIFSFTTLWSPYFLIFLIAMTALYFYLIRSAQKKWNHAQPLTTKEIVYFLLGIALVYITLGSPIDVLSHIMFSAHMSQMAILYLLAPIFFIWGIPDWAWDQAVIKGKLSKVFHVFTNPIIALILFNAIFSIYHIPTIFDAVKTNIWLHGIYTTVLFLLALFMWWPLVNTLQEERKLSGLKKFGYLLAASVLLTPACALIIFADTPMYLTYKDPSYWAEAMKLCLPVGVNIADLGITGPDFFNTMPLLDDQQLGGVLMKIMQEIIFGSILAYIFFNWYREEQEAEKEEQEKMNLKPNYAE